MGFIDVLKDRARANVKTIVLPETEDVRTLEATEKILKEGICHGKANSTRFVIVTNQKIFEKKAGKISICFEIPHESGSLYRMLSHFIYNNLNLSKIESRPLEDRNWEYRFFIDFDGNLADCAVKNALRGLRDEARYMRILGNY